ncbi:hypothetical protein QTP88_002472 [Uroleucon formosanum]
MTSTLLQVLLRSDLKNIHDRMARCLIYGCRALDNLNSIGNSHFAGVVHTRVHKISFACRPMLIGTFSCEHGVIIIHSKVLEEM